MEELSTICKIKSGKVTSMGNMDFSGAGSKIVIDGELQVTLGTLDVRRLRSILSVGTKVILFMDPQTDEVLYVNVFPRAIRNKLFTPKLPIEIKFVDHPKSIISNFWRNWGIKI